MGFTIRLAGTDIKYMMLVTWPAIISAISGFPSMLWMKSKTEEQYTYVNFASFGFLYTQPSWIPKLNLSINLFIPSIACIVFDDGFIDATMFRSKKIRKLESIETRKIHSWHVLGKMLAKGKRNLIRITSWRIINQLNRNPLSDFD